MSSTSQPTPTPADNSGSEPYGLPASSTNTSSDDNAPRAAARQSHPTQLKQPRPAAQQPTPRRTRHASPPHTASRPAKTSRRTGINRCALAPSTAVRSPLGSRGVLLSAAAVAHGCCRGVNPRSASP